MVLTGETLNKLKGQLAKEESEQLKIGVSFPHDVSPSIFLQRAFDVEAAQ